MTTTRKPRTEPEDSMTAFRRRGQRQAADLLVMLLTFGYERRLPLIHWALTPNGGTLVGEILVPLMDDADQRRKEFAAWRDALTDKIGDPPEQDKEVEFPGDHHRLVALWPEVEAYLKKLKTPLDSAGRIKVMLTADIYLDLVDVDPFAAVTR